MRSPRITIAKGAPYPYSDQIPKALRLPVLLPQTDAHAGILFGLVAAAVIYFVLMRTTTGIALDITGRSVRAAQYAGLKVQQQVMSPMAAGGALAGLAGGIEVLGLKYRLFHLFSAGYGFDGIVAAFMASANPALAPLSAFFLAGPRSGANAMQRAAGVDGSVVEASCWCGALAHRDSPKRWQPAMVRPRELEPSKNSQRRWGCHGVGLPSDIGFRVKSVCASSQRLCQYPASAASELQRQLRSITYCSVTLNHRRHPMQRISNIDQATANAEVRATLEAVKAKLGMIPNMMKAIAHAPSVLNGYLAFSAATGTGGLPGMLREQIALVTAQTNGCDYCASAHQALGKMAGLSAEEISRNFGGKSEDAKAQAALTFAQAVLAQRGKVSDAELAAVKTAGYSEGQVLEIVANVALNVFTNYVNNVANLEIDFPRVSTSQAA